MHADGWLEGSASESAALQPLPHAIWQRDVEIDVFSSIDLYSILFIIFGAGAGRIEIPFLLLLFSHAKFRMIKSLLTTLDQYFDSNGRGNVVALNRVRIGCFQNGVPARRDSSSDLNRSGWRLRRARASERNNISPWLTNLNL